MKKEILPQYVYRDKMGNSAALKEYYSLKFDNIDSCYEYIWKKILLQDVIPKFSYKSEEEHQKNYLELLQIVIFYVIRINDELEFYKSKLANI